MTEQQFEQIKKTNIWSIVSLFGGLSFFFGLPIVGSVVGIVAGNIAKKEILQSQTEMHGENLAKVGIITGWFGVFVWGIGGLCAFVLSITGLAVGLFSGIPLLVAITDWAANFIK